MIEVRRIVSAEAETFLNLLCGVFHLDVSRARPVFYDSVLFELNRKWALFANGNMVSILTTTGLTFGWGRCIGIAGVATDPAHQGRGYAHRLLETVLEVAASDGEGPAMLFAHQRNLYQQLGFELKDEVVRGRIAVSSPTIDFDSLPQEDVQRIYENWASGSPDRLVRTPDRWRYWNLACRSCEPFLGGYVCIEPGLVREAVTTDVAGKWPVPSGSDWYGLRTVIKACHVPVKRSRVELLFMTRGIPGQPQMFMTDQF